MRFAIKLLRGKQKSLEQAIEVIEEATGLLVPETDQIRVTLAEIDSALGVLQAAMAQRVADEERGREPETTPQTPNAKRGRGRPRKAPAGDRTVPLPDPNGEIPIEEGDVAHA